MDQDDTASRPVPAGWVEALDESDADLAAGRVLPATAVHAELRASIARLEAAPSANPAPAHPPRPAPGQGVVPNRP